MHIFVDILLCVHDYACVARRLMVQGVLGEVLVALMSTRCQADTNPHTNTNVEMVVMMVKVVVVR